MTPLGVACCGCCCCCHRRQSVVFARGSLAAAQCTQALHSHHHRLHPTLPILQFKLLGLIPITAPPSATGELDITYLDEELRISRGNRGNLFVLKMKDRKVKP